MSISEGTSGGVTDHADYLEPAVLPGAASLK
jgi:hypothetical protein